MQHSFAISLAVGLLIFAATVMGYLWATPAGTAQEAQTLNLVCAGLLIGALGIGIAARPRRGADQTIRQFVIWISVGAMTAQVYQSRDMIAPYVQETMLLANASQSAESGIDRQTVFIRMSRDGHFRTDALINNRRIHFLVDTGASRVVLTEADAHRLGFRGKDLDFRNKVSTANGITHVAQVSLRVVKIGSLVVSNVPASVVQGEGLSQSLLGMSYLSKLSGFSVNKNTLVLEK